MASIVMRWTTLLLGCSSLFSSVSGLPYDSRESEYNLNQNQSAVNPLDYWGEWSSHSFHPSPSNWRFPFYTLFLDRFVNGDPTNDNANGTKYEHDTTSTQLRHGGDLLGLIDSLDYLHGMGIKGLYIAGSLHINTPWGADSYSPLDMTLLDRHFGTIDTWRKAIDEIHKRGMYVVLDNTVATMGDLFAFDGYTNATAPFTLKEYTVSWKSNRKYHDFNIGNTYNQTCQYPRFWLETGERVGSEVTDKMVGCYNSDFDQYGDTEAFGVYPDWQRQLSKFASVQDRLREWVPSVRERIQHFSCLTIAMLDVDGFRIDKATQITVDALGDWSDHIRQCARRFGKENFFIPGEITGGNTFGSIYLGRGKEPHMVAKDLKEVVTATNSSARENFIRDQGKNALDAGAFHYSVYRSLTRFLGLDGNLASGYDTPVNWVDSWNTMLSTNDMINANKGIFDPRHMYGVTNQDVFRWPAIKQGTERMLLGFFITTLHMPGIPLLLWGEEQAFYVLDNTAPNYIFGRQAMSPSKAWQMHGCYRLGSAQYFEFPLEAARTGCDDEWNSLDHRDPSSPVRNIIKSMYFMRDRFPVLNDGYFLQQLSNRTRDVQYPGSNGTTTETGIWSTVRGRFENIQDLTKQGQGNQSVWLVYQNINETTTHSFDCTNNDSAIISPFDANTTVKNLFFPHDEYTLEASPKKLGIDGSKDFNGCIPQLKMEAYGFKAFVPKDKFLPPPAMITKFLPGHDVRLTSKVEAGKQDTVPLEIHFSAAMDCDSITANIQLNSTTDDKRLAQLDVKSARCEKVIGIDTPRFVGGIATAFTFKAKLFDVSNGIHTITVRNVSTENRIGFTNSFDRFMFRIGQPDNPMVFPNTANYTRDILHKDDKGGFYVSHKAAGADKFRYSLNWASTYSDWEEYTGKNTTLGPKTWNGTKRQGWDDEHVILQYWSRLAGSSDHVQHGDLHREKDPPRRFPHLFMHGSFNKYGFDSGLPNSLQLQKNGRWEFHFMTEWPTTFQINVWGINPDGQPDQSGVLGDLDKDFVLDRMPPSNLAPSLINISAYPSSPYIAYRISIDDGNYRYQLLPAGSRYQQMALFILLALIPVATGVVSVWAFMKSFYKVKFNQIGVTEKQALVPLALRRRFARLRRGSESNGGTPTVMNGSGPAHSVPALGLDGAPGKRRCVLIATMEYDIEDWGIKIKIGGLGVMAQLMGKNLGHQDLIWVVPCVGGVDYPIDQRSEPMTVTILGEPYEIQVQVHILRNITYVLLDAPVFRQQSKAEPYPARMDDLKSAIYYSAWNQCIALALKRFPVDLYHINDYHGALAPVHLLPDTIPCCLSLHNAEFQGLWPMRTPKECKEVCEVYNVSPHVARKYVQYGEVFNLLHAGASYLRVHQRGFGAVGVSAKYGKRSLARYPIFWGLAKIGKLPNPDPTDTGDFTGAISKDEDVPVDQEFEAGRAELKRQAQEWAGLEQNPAADLLVFVGRWSMQKGVDLIADIMPAVLEQNENVQLICVGPVIDLYGKFAALKLEKLMKLYPKRVFSKPEFTALPPYIFSGAEFALIPSRDEPFGLVAVEFGRKGALGIGARVGGLGQMPGWWYTVESTSTTHLIHQFKIACKEALGSKPEIRAKMRARSAKQRFPVVKWVEDLSTLQSTAIKIHEKENIDSADLPSTVKGRPGSGFLTPSAATAGAMTSSNRSSIFGTPSGAMTPVSAPLPGELPHSHPPSPTDDVTARNSAYDPYMAFRAGPYQNHLNPTQLQHATALEQRIGFAVTDEEDYHRPYSNALMNEHAINQLEGQNEYIDYQGRSAHQPSGLELAHSASDSNIHTPRSPRPDDMLLAPAPLISQNNLSTLSLDSVVGARKDFHLQKVDPFFTDSSGEFYQAFEKKLEGLDGKSSEDQLCIEDYLVKSEKKWFDRFRDAKLGRTGVSSSASSMHKIKRDSSPALESIPYLPQHMPGDSPPHAGKEERRLSNQFLLDDDYVPPKGVKKIMQYRVGDWPLYSFFLAFGQIIAANSYQITLLTGEVGQPAEKLYVIASIYLVTSILWWYLFRRMKSIYVLSIPFIFYGLAFFFIGITPFVHSVGGRGWVQNVATALYASASSSGSIFFALNFGDEGGAPVKAWVYRACVIQGTQQIYVVALWFWGSYLTKLTSAGVTTKTPINRSPVMTAITMPIAAMMWTIFVLLVIGLPDYYRQAPGKVPSFYKSLLRRKIITWFFVAVIIQNYWLSAPYGRNWQYLWSSTHAKNWQIAILVVVFFILVWAGFLWIFGMLSKDHSWIIPVFAVGLGAPRWCQMLWGTSNIGLYVPWVGGPVGGALAGRSLWLWLGVLDAFQGVGFGMILLQTLTRIHIACTLIVAQVLGSVATILARATAPNNIGPGDVFPDFSAGAREGLSRPWFWVALIFQLIICGGLFTFFRKEQLSKP